MLSKLKLFLKNRYKKPTKTSSRREFSEGNFAEFWCTFSNIGFFFVAFLTGDILLFLAGSFSFLSHAVPSQLIHDLDILGVILIGLKVLVSIPLLVLNPMTLPFVLGFGALAISINLLDAYITPRYYEKVGPWLHVAWHVTATTAMLVLNAATILSALSLFSISIPFLPWIAVGVGLVLFAGIATLATIALLTVAASSLKNHYDKATQNILIESPADANEDKTINPETLPVHAPDTQRFTLLDSLRSLCGTKNQVGSPRSGATHGKLITSSQSNTQEQHVANTP